MRSFLLCMVALTCVAARSPARDVAALVARQTGRAPQIRHVSRPRPGVVCGEVRSLALAGQYGAWWPFHIINGRAEVGEFYPEIWNRDPDPLEAAFYRAHRPCIKPPPPPPPWATLQRHPPTLLTDFPRELWANVSSRDVTLRVTVGTNGRALRCKVARRSGDPAFDARACRIVLAQARFKPAVNNAGHLMRADIPLRLVR